MYCSTSDLENESKKQKLTPKEEAILATLVDPDAPGSIKQLPWDETFQKRLLAAVLSDPEIMRDAVSILDPRFFSNQTHVETCKAAIVYFKQYAALPEKFWLQTAVVEAFAEKDAGYRLMARAQIDELLDFFVPGLVTRKALLDRLTEFAKRQATLVECRKVMEWKDNPKGSFDDLLREISTNLSKIVSDKCDRPHIFSLAELEGLPRSPWLVKGHLPKDSTAVIYGPSGAGKTFFAIDIGLSVASGKPLCGSYSVATGKVVYLVGEGINGFQDRVKAWLNHFSVRPSEENFVVETRPVNLLDAGVVSKFLDDVRQRLGGNPDLIIIDTLAKNFGGGDENSTKDMGVYVASKEWLRSETGACVCSIHHTGKDEDRGARGSNSLRAGVDVEILVTEIENGSRVEVKKQKNDERIGAYLVRHKTVFVRPDEDGNPWSTLVLEYLGTAREVEHKKVEEIGDKDAERYLEAVPILAGQDVTLENGMSIKDIREKTGLTQRTEIPIRERLLNSGRLQVAEFVKRGQKTLRFYREVCLVE